jgi:hypothetical protein
MSKTEIVKTYFYHLKTGNYPEIINLFSKNSVVMSPLYGERNPTDFYKELFSDTNQSKIDLKNIFVSDDQPNTIAAHFLYNWTMKNGNIANFECIDVFELNNENKIDKLTIIYDTYQTRIKFDKLKN